MVTTTSYSTPIPGSCKALDGLLTLNGLHANIHQAQGPGLPPHHEISEAANLGVKHQNYKSNQS